MNEHAGVPATSQSRRLFEGAPHAPGPDASAPGEVSILLVEDNPGDARLIRELLREDIGLRGVHLTLNVAGLLSEALRLLVDDRPSLVLLDLSLPDSAGVETFRSVHECQPSIPIVVLTGLDDIRLGVTIVGEGAQDYLVKGKLAEDELGRAIRYAIQRNAAEGAVREAESRLRDTCVMLQGILESSPSPVFSVDTEYRYTSFNRAHAESMKTLFGSDIKIGDGILKHIGPVIDRETAKANIDRALRGEVVMEEAETGDESLARRWYEVSHNPIIDSGKKVVGVSVFSRDTTARRKAEESLRASEEQLRQSQKMEAIGQLAGGIAHDFNNLLTAIIGYDDLILGGLEGESEALRPDLEEIKHAADRASALTRQILAFSRRQALHPMVVSLNDVLAGMEPLLHRTLGENVELVTLLRPDLGHSELDVHQFEQVLMNLALNARDAMPAGGRLTLETGNVELDEEYCRSHADMKPGSYVMMSASDTGVGMDPVTTSRIFEPFYTTKAPGQGTGLGLSTVYGIVRQSGGGINVYSEPDKGTSFKVYVPRVDTPVSPAETSTSATSSFQGEETVFVVEDEESLRHLVARILGGLGYHVLLAASADEAFEVLSESACPVDLLLTDVVLPGSMQGNDLAHSLLASRPDLPVLYMSGYTRNAIVHSGHLDTGVNYLEKPFTPAALAAMVRQVLDAEGGQNR
jgi:two-component system, cell cycle sensor histidine kinase and response regulator CckA